MTNKCFANVAVTVLQEIAPRVSELQAWLYEVGHGIARSGARPQWVVPVTGFRVIQPETEKNRGEHKLSSSGMEKCVVCAYLKSGSRAWTHGRKPGA